jgi:hypothetical protein
LPQSLTPEGVNETLSETQLRKLFNLLRVLEHVNLDRAQARPIEDDRRGFIGAGLELEHAGRFRDDADERNLDVEHWRRMTAQCERFIDRVLAVRVVSCREIYWLNGANSALRFTPRGR